MGNRLYIDLQKVESYHFAEAEPEGKLVLADTNWEIKFGDDFETHSVTVPEDFFTKIPTMSTKNFREYLMTCLRNSDEFLEMLQAHWEQGVYVSDCFLDTTEIPGTCRRNWQFGRPSTTTCWIINFSFSSEEIKTWVTSYAKLEKDAKVMHSNVYFEDQIGDITFTGYIDQIRKSPEGSLEVIMFKTGSQSPHPAYLAVQPTSRIEGAQEGRFYNSLTGELREKLENIVFLTRRNGRVLFPADDFSGLRLCWSNDGINPAADSVLLQTGDQPKSHGCVVRNNGDKKIVCPFAQWQKTEKGNVPSECRETISFLGLEMQSLTPFFMIFHGTGIPPVKNFISSVYLKKKQATMHSQELHLQDFRVTLSLKLEMNDKGKFYYPVFEKIEAITAEPDRAMLRNCFAALSKKEIEDPIKPDEA